VANILQARRLWKTAQCGASQFLFFTRYYMRDHIKENENHVIRITLRRDGNGMPISVGKVKRRDNLENLT
jgi:hypothetical protein